MAQENPAKFHEEHHIVSPRTYLMVFGALLVGTGLTVGAAFVEMGPFNPVVAILIACVKAVLVDSAEHAAGWAMFADRRLALAVARGSGPAVAQLGGGGAPGRDAGQPARDRRRLAGRRRQRRRRTLRRRGRGLAGPQGVQHPQRLLHRARAGGRTDPAVPGRPGAGRRSAGPRRASCTSSRATRAGCPPAWREARTARPPRRRRSRRALADDLARPIWPANGSGRKRRRSP